MGAAPPPTLRRVLLKLSGEALLGRENSGVDMAEATRIAEQVRDVRALGVDVAIVVGGGNFLRGASQAELGMDRATGDYMGMLATVLNALPLRHALEQAGVEARVMSALQMPAVAEPYVRERALRHLDRGRVVIFAGGTGSPFVTTDTAAAFRALEIGADALLAAKNGVRGVYDRDPRTHDDAQFIAELTHDEAITRGLRVMDGAAFALCAEHGMPIHVFDMSASDSVTRIGRGERVGTLVRTAASAIEGTPSGVHHHAAGSAPAGSQGA